MIAGVLLTGGRSTRLGVDKARVAFDGETLAQRAARVLSAVCDPCVEVGSGASSFRCVRESPEGEGPLAGFVTGARHLASSSSSVVLLACDMPLVSEALLRFVAQRPAHSVVPIARGRPQYGCAKYGGRVLDAMCDAFDEGQRSFKWLHGSALHDEIEWLSEAVWGEHAELTAFRDLDTRDDARELGITVP